MDWPLASASFSLLRGISTQDETGQRALGNPRNWSVMLRLNLLGPLDLRDADGNELRAVLQQPKRFALLASLVLTADGAYRRRDALLGLFWPDLDQEHARGALRRALYFLRRALGDGVIVTRGEEEVGIADGAAWCDATAFEDAVRAGRGDEARALYRGDLLDGFYISGAAGAEQWFDAERARLRTMREHLGDAPPAGSAPAPSPRSLPDRPVQRDVLAVLPFAVRAGPPLQYLGEGMLDLLASALDGAGALRVADVRASLASSLPDAGASDASDLDAVARSLGAGWIVAGTVIVAGEKLRISAALHATGRGIVRRAEVNAAGEEGLFDAVDELAREIITGLSEEPASRPALLAARTSSSWPALKLFLQGEHHFRLGDYGPAMQRFEEATTRDAEFSLAWYRTASTRAANAMIAEARDANRRSLARRERLSPHARAMLEAQEAWLGGDLATAERRYAAVVADHPDDVEAWYLLGDVQFHGNSYRGRRASAARPAFQQALSLDQGHAATLGKLARLAVLDGDDELFDTWFGRLADATPGSAQEFALRVVRAMRTRKLGDIARLGLDLPRARARDMALALGHAALYGGSLALVEQVGSELIARVQSPELRAYGVLLLAEGALAQGSWERAEARWGEALVLDRGWTLVHRGLRASNASLGASDAVVAQAVASLVAWEPDLADRHVATPLAIHDDLAAHIRCYVLGLLAVRQGDAASAAGWAEDLAELDVIAGWGPAIEMMQRTLEAARRSLASDDAAALRILEEGRHATWFQHAVASPVYSATEARLLRGLLLLRAGRREEAAGWLHGIGEGSPWELALRGPASQAINAR